MMDSTPILTTLDINIGGFFVYKDELWVRTGRYVASSANYSACRFGHFGDDADNYNDKEWQNVLDTAKPVSSEDVNRIFMASYKGKK